MDKDKRSKIHSLIHVETPDEEALDISDMFTTKFDYIIKKDLYVKHENTLTIYNIVREIFADSNKIKTPIITFSSDQNISSSTISGLCEKYLYIDGDTPTYNSNLKVIYIDSNPDISTKEFTNYVDFGDAIISNAMGLMNSSYTNHKVNIDSKNIYFIGINSDILDNETNDAIKNYNLNVFTLEHIRKKGIESIMKYIYENCQYENVHVVLDLCAINKKIAPSVYRDNRECASDGLDYDDIKIIMQYISKLTKFHSIDITGYNFGNKKDRNKHYVSNILTTKTIQQILSYLTNLETKSINIFNDDSRFLIWKKMNDDDQIGWLILRGLDIIEREEIIKYIEKEDIIITIPINYENEIFDALITTTSIREQQEKSYYSSKNVFDCCLYPGEKMNMMFEMLNTPKNKFDINNDNNKNKFEIDNNKQKRKKGNKKYKKSNKNNIKIKIQKLDIQDDV